MEPLIFMPDFKEIGRPKRGGRSKVDLYGQLGSKRKG